MKNSPAAEGESEKQNNKHFYKAIQQVQIHSYVLPSHHLSNDLNSGTQP